jgi:hypothetical protein
MSLTADNILTAFAALAAELERQNERAELLIVGGAALVLLFHARESTKDVDAYFVRPEGSVIRSAAASVADALDLPADWLNDGAKAYLVGASEGTVLFESSSLIVRAAAIPQLLAMKLAAWRDAVDRADARLLLEKMSGAAHEIWARVQPFVPAGKAEKASYAFDDLWEAVHGNP